MLFELLGSSSWTSRKFLLNFREFSFGFQGNSFRTSRNFFSKAKGVLWTLESSNIREVSFELQRTSLQTSRKFHSNFWAVLCTSGRFSEFRRSSLMFREPWTLGSFCKLQSSSPNFVEVLQTLRKFCEFWESSLNSGKFCLEGNLE